MLFIIRNTRAVVIACLTILSTSLAAAPLLYEIDSPLYSDAPHKVTIYQQDDFAVGVHNPADRPALRGVENGPPQLLGQGPFGQKFSRMQRLAVERIAIENKQACAMALAACRGNIALPPVRRCSSQAAWGKRQRSALAMWSRSPAVETSPG